MSYTLAQLRRRAGQTALRLRLAESVRSSTRWLLLPIGYSAAALTALKLTRAAGVPAWALVGAGLAGTLWLGATLRPWLRRRGPYFGALALDAHHRQAGRVANALAFSEVPAAERAPMMQAAIDDALARAPRLEPRRAAPVGFPRDLPFVALLAALTYGLSTLELRRAHVEPVAHRLFEPVVMTADDLELLRQIADELEQQSTDPQARSAVRRFNQLVEDIAERRLDRREVFRQLEQLEQSGLDTSEAEAAAQQEGLEGMARELAKSELAKPTAAALAQQQLADAEAALRELADKLRREHDKPSRAHLDELRKALQKASQQNLERHQALTGERQRLERERQRLLQKKREQGKLDERERRDLERTERQLDKLDRQQQRSQQAQRQLSELDRQLAQAASDLMRELGADRQQLEQAAKDLEQAASEVKRQQQSQLSRQQKEELKRKLEELRQLLRQQGKGGQGQRARLERFAQRAHGASPGQQGAGGKPGRAGQGAQGQQGQGQQQRGQGSPALMLGPPGSGAPLPIPGGPGGQGSAGPAGAEPGSGAGQGGESWGTGHDPSLQGKQTALRAQTKDVSAAGVDTGQGVSASQVIYGAAERGFRGKGYQQVFGDYQTVAEETLQSDEIPPGYRFYVRRYFQLIRPRD